MPKSLSSCCQVLFILCTPNTRNHNWRPSLITIPIRYSSFSSFFPSRHLSNLESQADSHPNDPNIQASLYKHLLNSNAPPHLIITRFEQYNRYASNEDCLACYITALNRAGMDGAKHTSNFGSAGEYGKSDGVIGKGNDGSGTLENPVYVVMKDCMFYIFPAYIKFMTSQFSLRKALFSFFKTAAWAFFILTGVSLVLESQAGHFPDSLHADSSQDVKFADVAGVDEAKAELEEVVEFLKDPEKFTRLGGKMTKGILLTGPPGTGKTLLARAVAGESSVPFFHMSGSEFDELYIGVGARRVRELFAAAKKNAPSIVFIDELDAVGGKRSTKGEGYMRQTLNQLLVDLDGFSQSHAPVIFIAATNFPDLLDPALLRPGRFDKIVTVPLPDYRGRLEILKVHMQDKKMAADVKVENLARGTVGFSGADLSNLLNQAAIRASLSSSSAITLSDIEYAKDKILMGSERKSAVISKESKTLTAYHEAGHALVAMFTKGAMKLDKVSVVPRGRSLGVTVQLPETDKDNYTKAEYLAMLDVCLGGRAAEELIFGEDNVTCGAHNDIEKATEIARRMVMELGMSDKVGLLHLPASTSRHLSSTTRALIESEIKSFIETSFHRVKNLLKQRNTELTRLAEALVEYETLKAEEVGAVVKGEWRSGR
ncbi:peptidase family M41-domain-containing protein [Paraphysoderma sedebokerense]|nr:peptidase family M41-domain-containing protein [Paraphysoderma sedebokerense]